MGLKRDLLTRLLPYFPDGLLCKALRGRPYIIHNVPQGREFVWPYYLSDTPILVNTSNPLERESLTGTYDRGLSRYINCFVRPDDVCIDGGANVGLVTLLMAKTVGGGGRVYAVEPGDVYLERLRKNLELNPSLAGVVRIMPVGLSDREGMLLWSPDPNAPYNAWFMPFVEVPVDSAVSLPVTTLDALARSEGLNRLDFVKLDLEGMELWALRGASEVLARYRPAVLFESLEMWRNTRGLTDVFRQIGELLVEAGYDLYYLPTEGNLVQITTERMPQNTLALHRNDPRLLAPI